MSDFHKIKATVEKELKKLEKSIDSNKMVTKTKSTLPKVKDYLQTAPNKLSDCKDNAINGIPSSSTLAKVSYWGGLSSIVVGFPANLVAIVSGVAFEDRLRFAKRNHFKKAADKLLLPSAKEIRQSRIGLAVGAASLVIGGIVLVSKIAHDHRKSKEV